MLRWITLWTRFPSRILGFFILQTPFLLHSFLLFPSGCPLKGHSVLVGDESWAERLPSFPLAVGPWQRLFFMYECVCVCPCAGLIELKGLCLENLERGFCLGLDKFRQGTWTTLRQEVWSWVNRNLFPSWLIAGSWFQNGLASSLSPPLRKVYWKSLQHLSTRLDLFPLPFEVQTGKRWGDG